MDKYIKWELKNFFKKKVNWFIFIGIIYLLFIVLPMESSSFLSGLVIFLFSLIMSLSVFGSFFFGAKNIVDSYKEKTFLLESMIPMPVKKIVLSKYILGIIINLTFSLVTILGLVVISIKGNSVKELIEIIESIFTELSFLTILRASILYILSTIFFLSFVVLCFVTLKVIKPNSSGNKIIGYICWFIILYSYGFIMANVLGFSSDTEIITDILCLTLSGICYYSTAWLTENKLEIYN